MTNNNLFWEEMESMPAKHQNGACALDGDIFYFARGYDYYSTNSTFSSNIAEDSWIELSPMVHGRFGAGLSFIGYYLTVFGGFDLETLDSMEEFNGIE